MKSAGRFTMAVAVAGALAACGDRHSLAVPEPVIIDVPFTTDASLPHVAAADGAALVSWVERSDTGHVLVFAAWDGADWSVPRRVAHGQNWFINWADFPSVVSLGGARMAAHWLQRSGGGTYAYDVMVTQSADHGVTWSAPVRPHTDGTPTEHGFVSLFPLHDSLAVVWLDGRSFDAGPAGPATNEMSIRHAIMAPTGPVAEHVIDSRVCDCCQTSVALTAAGPLLVYRDRSPGEVRDIAVTRLIDGAWSEPQPLHEDGWRIDACPVNGPQADALDDAVAVAWFTAAQDTPRVLVAFSQDAGASFSAPTRVDGGDPIGRVAVLLLDGQRALVSWLERTADGAAVRTRIATGDGRTGEPRTVGHTTAQRPSGFPRMGRYDSGVLIAWTEPGDPSVVRAAHIPVRGR